LNYIWLLMAQHKTHQQSTVLVSVAMARFRDCRHSW